MPPRTKLNTIEKQTRSWTIKQLVNSNTDPATYVIPLNWKPPVLFTTPSAGLLTFDPLPKYLKNFTALTAQVVVEVIPDEPF